MSAKVGKGRISETYTECASIGFLENYTKPPTQPIWAGHTSSYKTRYSGPKVM